MNDVYDDGMMVVLFLVMAAACFLPGMLLGGMIQKGADREKFIMYCTTKGETYANCSDIWIGKLPIQLDRQEGD